MARTLLKRSKTTSTTECCQLFDSLQLCWSRRSTNLRSRSSWFTRGEILTSEPAQIGRIWDQNAFELPLVRLRISPSTITCTVNPAQMDYDGRSLSWWPCDWCCAQQTGMHIDWLWKHCLMSIYLGSELILVDIRKAYRSSTCLVRYSWFLPSWTSSAGSCPAEVYELANRNRNAVCS